MGGRRGGYAEEVGGGAELGGAAEEERRRAALRPLDEAAVAAEKGLHGVDEDHAEDAALRRRRR